MEGFKHRVVIVQLGQRRIELDQEEVVHSGMTDIVADSGYQKSQCVERCEDRAERCFRDGLPDRVIRGKSANV